MSKPQTILLGVAIACATYIPIGMYLFDNPLSTMLDRAYFMMAGAATALYAQGSTCHG